jgi:phospholipid/cholesterol/gamma-HCH transport system permease protein
MPLLAAMFSAMGVFGGWLIGVVFIGVDDGAFWSQMQSSVDFRYDIMNGVIKSVVFGFAVSLIAVFEGMTLSRRPRGFRGPSRARW